MSQWSGVKLIPTQQSNHQGQRMKSLSPSVLLTWLLQNKKMKDWRRLCMNQFEMLHFIHVVELYCMHVNRFVKAKCEQMRTLINAWIVVTCIDECCFVLKLEYIKICILVDYGTKIPTQKCRGCYWINLLYVVASYASHFIAHFIVAIQQFV